MRACILTALLALAWAPQVHAAPKYLIQDNPKPFQLKAPSLKSLYLVETQLLAARNGAVLATGAVTTSVGIVGTSGGGGEMTQVFLEDVADTSAQMSVIMEIPKPGKGMSGKTATGTVKLVRLDHTEVPFEAWTLVVGKGNYAMRIRVGKIVRA